MVSALAFSPDGLKLAAGDVSTYCIFLFVQKLNFFRTKKKKKPFSLVNSTPVRVYVCGCPDFVIQPPLLGHVQSKNKNKKTVQWKSHPLRRHEARGDHLPLGLPFSAGKLVELDRGLATLRLRCARHAYIRLERPEAHEKHCDQERSARGCQCGPLVVR